MITAPFTAPKVGMILFSEKLALMVKVTATQKDGFLFRCLQGDWDGAVRDGQVRIEDAAYRAHHESCGTETDDPEPSLGESDFAQVISVTRHEYEAWYLAEATGAENLINRKVEAAPVLIAPDADDDYDEDRPGPVYEASILLTVLGQGESPKGFESWVASLSLEDLGREMDQGELVGASRILSSAEVPPDEIRTRLEEVGSDETFFEGVGPAGKAVPVATRISDLRDQQGWNDGSMEHLAAAFIRETGLERAFLAHLQRQADLENSNDKEGYEP